MPKPPEIRSVGLCVRPASPAAGEAARALAEWLTRRGLQVLGDPEAAEALGASPHSREQLSKEVDRLVALGGDGTLLAVAREMGPRSVPILGVNLGKLGFLTEVAPEEQIQAIESVLRGETGLEERMRLDVRAERDGRSLAHHLALNDAVVSRSVQSRMVELEARADGEPVATYRGDGLIVSTPTGSTAYSLSAGGPLLHPGLHAFVVTPICPHTLTQRPIVLPEKVCIEVEVGSGDGELLLSVDGQARVALHEGDRVHVRRSEHPARFVAFPDHSRFEVLRTKLNWGAG